MFSKKCVDCGAVFETKAHNKVRCNACQRKHELKLSREHMRKKRGWVEPISDEDDPNVCKKVKTCEYGGIAGALRICNYMEIVGHKRPCDVENCTEYANVFEEV